MAGNTGIKCTNPRCSYSMVVPAEAAAELRTPSAEITCPKCNKTQPADAAWIAFEEAMSKATGGTNILFSIPTTPRKSGLMLPGG